MIIVREEGYCDGIRHSEGSFASAEQLSARSVAHAIRRDMTGDEHVKDYSYWRFAYAYLSKDVYVISHVRRSRFRDNPPASEALRQGTSEVKVFPVIYSYDDVLNYLACKTNMTYPGIL